VADVSGRTYRSSSSSSSHEYGGFPNPETAGEGDSGRRRRRSGSKSKGAPSASGASAPKNRKRRRDPLWAKLFVVFGALLMLGSGGALAGGKLLLTSATSSVNKRNLLGDAGVEEGKRTSLDGRPINMLLVGLDVRAGQDPGELVRSDTIVILHIPATHDQAYLVSLPRDARVKIPDYPKTNFKGWSTKINAAFAFGHKGPGTEDEKRARGVELLALTIRDLTGIKFNGAAIIDFVGFEAVLRELGGVQICVDRPAESIHLAENKDGKLQRVWYDENRGVQDVLPGYHPVRYKVGCQRLSAEKALDYSRIRKGTCCPQGDYDRQRHQQQLLKAMVKEATGKGILSDPAKALRVTQAAGKAFTLDTQGIPLEEFIFTLKGVTANEMMLVKTNAGKVNTIPGSSDEQLSNETLQMLRSLRDGKLIDFLSTHQEYIAPAG
jgi:LCP family protein required for cell wall assembly